MPTQKLKVAGMTAGDAETIVASLNALEGVLFVSVSPGDPFVEIEFEDDCVTISEVTETLARLGFSATPAG